MRPRSVRPDQWSAAGLGGLAVGYLLGGHRYALDTLANPGPGIFPLAAGLALLALAVWQWLDAARRPVQPRGPAIPRAPVVMSGVLVLYAAALPRLGFLVPSAALVFTAARLMGLSGWWRPAALALGVTVATRVIFVGWLGVPLP